MTELHSTEGSAKNSQKTKIGSKTAAAMPTRPHPYNQNGVHKNQAHKSTHRGGKKY